MGKRVVFEPMDSFQSFVCFDFVLSSLFFVLADYEIGGGDLIGEPACCSLEFNMPRLFLRLFIAVF